MIISGFRLCVDVDSTVVGVMAWSGGTRLAGQCLDSWQLDTAVVLGKAVASAAVPPLRCHQPHCVSLVSAGRGCWSCDGRDNCSGNTWQLEEISSGVMRR